MKTAIVRPPQFVQVPGRRPGKLQVGLLATSSQPKPRARPAPRRLTLRRVTPSAVLTLAIARPAQFVRVPGRAADLAVQPAARLPVPATVIIPRPLLLRRQPTPRALAPTDAGQAVAVGVLGGSGALVSMVPADLTVGPRTDITNFSVTLDAGTF